MAKPITAADIDRVAANLDVQLTDWQRTFLVDAFDHRARLGTWPYFHFGRQGGRATIRRVALAAVDD